MTTNAGLGIGEFSSLARISVRMLRHYDQHGLLAPAAVDPFTGRRSYSREQLVRAGDIRRLRDVGFGVAAIGALLAARGTEDFASAIATRRAELLQELDEAADRLALFRQLFPEEGKDMPAITVSTATVPAATIVALRGTIPSYPEEGVLWGRLMPLLAAAGVVLTGPGGVIEHDGEYRESDVDESVWVPVAPGTHAPEPLQVISLPTRETVVARVEGPYSLITEAHARIGAYALEHGLTLAAGGPDAPLGERNFNVYLSEPDAEGGPITEVHMPLA
ncbi:MerR family transcriptional regulator [Galactobacter valiniphilus]|uniref:MerR family transcriptional regulator n=1 Tax=Galactobacter valiniphilus TaxID=2676122 RepID=UPI0037360273